MLKLLPEEKAVLDRLVKEVEAAGHSVLLTDTTTPKGHPIVYVDGVGLGIEVFPLAGERKAIRVRPEIGPHRELIVRKVRKMDLTPLLAAVVDQKAAVAKQIRIMRTKDEVEALRMEFGGVDANRHGDQGGAGLVVQYSASVHSPGKGDTFRMVLRTDGTPEKQRRLLEAARELGLI